MPTASSLRDSVSPSLPSTYAELHVTTNFTFLTGASHPEEFVERAAALGLGAIAITDRNSLAGVVRAHIAAKETGIPLVVGCRVELTAKDSPSPSDTSRLRDSVPSCLDRETSARSSAARDGVPPRNGASDINTTSSLRDFVSSSLSILLFPTSRSAYGHLCQLLTLGKRRAPKGECHLTLDDVLAHHEGLLAVVIPPPVLDDAFTDVFHRLKRTFDDDRLSLAVSREYGPNDHARLAHLAELARDASIPLVATNDVHYHIPERRKLQDVVTCIRHGCTIHEAGFRLIANAERPLKAPKEMARLFAAYPDAITRTVEIAQRALQFNLDELRYEYPDEVCPQGMTPMQHLRRLTWRGADERYPGGIPDRVRAQVEHEFELIEELNYAPYFLTVHDLVIFARSRGILCQGRGAAANSAVCYCLGVTAVDPDRIDLLFERFVSKERNEPPDIDIDFEHERREEVIQYIYRKYGRDRAALTAEVISYRGRSAVREVGKAMGLSLDCVDRLAKNIDWWHDGVGDPRVLRDIGVNPDDPTIRAVMALSHEILGFPRHLSQHVGGFVITRTPLSELVPIENAAMPDRTVIEWDKDDIDAMGMLKVDCLGLGMLTCISKALRLVNEGRHGGRGKRDEETERRRDGETRRRSDRKGSPPTTLSLRHSVSSSLPDRPLELHTIPPEDPLVYDMICAADTIGVFQIESRAQMTMLPRLRPRCFYDLVIEVAIVRPGPIQGDMVHPYLRRRNGEEPVTFPNDEVKKVLGKTLGVPLFQEQAMSLAIVAAGFTPGEADRLRRAMAAWKRSGNQMKRFGERFITGMLARGYERDFAERCFRQIQGFSDYGFPESHAASFALLVYVSAWLKRHHPAEFAAALINSQPMGFYAPAQIVRDAQEHGVEVRPIDVQCSEWDCTVEEGDEETESRRDGVVGCAATHTVRKATEQWRDEEMERRRDGVRTTNERSLWRSTMAGIRTFRDIVAWQKGMELTRSIYHLTRLMPSEERFELAKQMRGAAASIPSNIAEGFGRQGRPDLLRFLRIARGSLYELMTQYELAIDLELIGMDSTISDLITETDRVLQALIRSLEDKGTTDTES
jgi:error-prone DNA polymerase